jgi:flagellar basal-body rod protein FlgB
MTDPITSDSSIRAAKLALDGLSAREEIIGNNLANIDTPGYQSQDVDFRTTLRKAVDSNQSLQMVSTNKAHLASPAVSRQIQVQLKKGGTERADGNNVDIDVELTEMTETVVQYQAMSQLISKKFLLLKTIANGR